ncbi:MAG: dihydropteroate synthase [Candidatus Omnitrophica bacterium]|nr:dihydropteroate synthase [Candidatus Omnitrophota bacterium]
MVSNLQPGQYTIPTGMRTLIMGIVNATPDSFSQDGCWIKGAGRVDAVVKKVLQQVRDGADIIDIGGESSRPGSLRLSEKEEIERVIPAITRAVKKVSVPVSVDTYKLKVAQMALDAGAVIVNNIQGVRLSKNLLRMISRYQASIVLMHMRGTPRTMQKKIAYNGDVMAEIIRELGKSVQECLDAGLTREQIIVDPGIGFGKTVENNCEIIARLSELKTLQCPILIGTSRKSFIGQILGQDEGNRLNGTIASVAASIINGANIVRVHDVKENKEAAMIIDKILRA